MADESPAQTLGALALVVVLVGGFAAVPRVIAWLQRGNGQLPEAPDFTLPIVANGAQLPGDQSRVHLGDLRGSVVLLDFWATWCPPCRAEAPIVDRVARRWRDRGVMVVGVNEDRRDEGDPRAFALNEGLSYPIAIDPGGQTMHRYGADGLPTLVIVSRTGKVTAVQTGITEDAELERLIRQAL
jgi:cytochrome c biogenesis protein CcmG/thiol:disulfide interchange protein DsbE